MSMDPIVTITLSHWPDPAGPEYTQQTQFSYSQRNTPAALAAISTLHDRLVASIPPAPKHVHCTDGSVRVRKHW